MANGLVYRKENVSGKIEGWNGKKKSKGNDRKKENTENIGTIILEATISNFEICYPNNFLRSTMETTISENSKEIGGNIGFSSWNRIITYYIALY